MKDNQLYKWLQKCPTEWELVRQDEGVRWIRFNVDDEPEEE